MPHPEVEGGISMLPGARRLRVERRATNDAPSTTPLNPARDLPLLAAWRLRVPAHALRPLARGDHAPLRAWLGQESALRLAEARRDAHLDLAALERLGARIVTPDDADWPRGFDDLRDPPAFLTVRGTLPAGGVAIVGARDADEGACAFAHALATRLGRAVISGLARGIDAAAHRGALDASLATVAYVGTGLARTFPPEHAELAETIVARGGAVAAERPPHDAASDWSLMRRDRLQAAHAAAVVLVVSDDAGGAMHTLRRARELGRARFALDTDASGNRAVLADGAVPLLWDAGDAAETILSSTKSGST
jgi:DNA processing protein